MIGDTTSLAKDPAHTEAKDPAHTEKEKGTWRTRVRQVWSYLGRFLNYALIIAALVFTLWQLKKGQAAIGDIDYSLNVGYLALVLMLHTVGLSLGGLGWALIVRTLNPGASLSHSIQVYYITNVPKNIPGSAWHILGRLYFHQKSGETKTSTAIAVVLELTVTAWAGALVYLLGLLTSSYGPTLSPIYPLGLLLVASLALFPPVFKRVSRVFISRMAHLEGVQINLDFKQLFTLLGLYSFLVTLGGFLLFLTINAIYAPDWNLLPSVVGAWGISLMVTSLTFWIPIALRLRDGIVLVALTPLMPAATALMVVVIWHFVIILSEVIWALIVSLISLLFFDQEQMLWSEVLERWPKLNRLRQWIKRQAPLDS